MIVTETKKKGRAPPLTRDEVSKALVRKLEALQARAAAPRPAELEHGFFDDDRAAIVELASVQAYAQAWRAQHPDDTDMQRMAKALRLCCRASTLQDAHRWLRVAVMAAKDFQYRALAEHGIRFAVKEAKRARKPDKLQAAIIELFKRNPKLRVGQAWDAIAQKPPRGVEFVAGAAKPRFEWGSCRPHEQCELAAFRGRVTRAKQHLAG